MQAETTRPRATTIHHRVSRLRPPTYDSLPVAGHIGTALDESAADAIAEAMRVRRPLLLRSSSRQSAAALASSWARYIDNDHFTYQTNGAQSDGSSSAAERKTLSAVWRGPYRVETQLRDEDSGSPVVKWLEGSDRAVASSFERLV